MIPIQLTIEGLYSYQERQSIDFSNLTDAGIFGIFGTVGSGKSSILEAITFALYGETERMNSREKRAYNMMNLKSNKSLIDFEFYNYNDDKYKITRAFKRNSKQFEDVKPDAPVLYKWTDGEWLPLEHSNIEPIIGLSYDNFKRTIIIPQGQFKEFIELGAKDRTQMMKEIFGLQRFDLQDKAAVLSAKTKSDLDVIRGKLSGYEDINEEVILNLKNELQANIAIEEGFQKEFTEVNTVFQRLKALKDDFDNLNSKKRDFSILQEQKPSKDEQEKELRQYEDIYRVFYPLFAEFTKISKELKEKSKVIAEQEHEKVQIEKELKEVSDCIKSLQPLIDDLPNQRKVELDLEKIAEILEFTKDILQLKERREKGEKMVLDEQQKEKNIQEQIRLSEDNLSALSQNKIEASILMQVESWFAKQENLAVTQQRHWDKITELNGNINKIDLQFSELQVDVNSFELDYQQKFDALEQSKKTLQGKKSELEVQQKLAQYTHQLHDGEACPLCGALEHPHIVEVEDVSTKLTQVVSDLDALEANQKTLQKNLEKLRQLKQEKEFYSKQLFAEKKLLTNVKQATVEHHKSFEWAGFDAQNKNDFENKKNASLEVERLISAKNEELKQLRDGLESVRTNVQKFQSALEKFKIEEGQKETQISQNNSQLKVLEFEEYQSTDKIEVEVKLQHLKAKNDKLEYDFQALNLRFNTLNPSLASKESSIALLKSQVAQLGNEQQDLEKQMDIELEKSQQPYLDAVKAILAKKLDVRAIQEELEQFKIRFQTLNNAIQDLEQKLDNVSFDENIFSENEERLNAISLQLKEATAIVTKSQTEIARLEKEFEAKKELLQESLKIEKRAENLKTLSNLFKGAGFVQYVSSIYLRQLCDHANVRFHRMTRNQLSLQLNENNDFEIIDYLNEGKSRSVKTLSGGQAFQVSLSLALALAESVQSQARSNRNFFFIDEGFGTQDQESINIVFETLQSLQKENRIVGIISHVEELKERIPISLNVHKDTEKGSLIEVSNQ